MGTSHRFLAILLVAATIACRSSAERARIEMQSVYRAAKALDKQIKAGADLIEVHKLQGNLATELAIVHDRMMSNPSMDELLRQHYAAYQVVLRSYSLVTDIVEYDRTMEQCIAPRHEGADEAYSKLMSLSERIADLNATSEFVNRILKCSEQYRDLNRSLHQRADVLGMNCPKFESDSGCLVKFAEIKMVGAENPLLLGTRENAETGNPGTVRP